MVWCPRYRRPVLDGRVKNRREELIGAKADEHGRQMRAEFPHLRSRLPTLWSRSSFVVTVDAVSVRTAQRHIGTQDERASPGGGRA